MFMKNRPMTAIRTGPLDRWKPRLACSTARTLGEPVPIPREAAGELSASKYQAEFAEEYWQDWCRMLDTSL